MKKKLAAILALGLSAAALSAQTFTVLHRFLADGVDGIRPSAALTVSGGNLYGITVSGGTNLAGPNPGGNGTLFKLSTSGSDYQILRHFGDPSVGDPGSVFSSDGANPVGSPVVDGDTIYGATTMGLAGNGRVYALKTDGTGYRLLHNFYDYHQGFYPSSGLFLKDGQLWGTCLFEGDGLLHYDAFPNPHQSDIIAHACGTLYTVATNAVAADNYSQFQVRSTFQDFIPNINNPVTYPVFDLVYIPTNNWGETEFLGATLQPGGSMPWLLNGLMGIQMGGGIGDGSHGFGSIYGRAADGSPYIEHAFTGGADGAYPTGSPLLAYTNATGWAMYGVTAGDYGWTNTAGTLYTCWGYMGFAVLHTFSTNTGTKGTGPVGKLVKIGDVLYGVTKSGGRYDGGTIYQIHTDGTGFKVLHSFFPSTDGSAPMVGLAADGNILYGTTTAYGGGNGTVFKLDLNPPPLFIKSIPVMTYTNQLLVFTNILGPYTNTMGGFQIFYVTNYSYVTNHVGVVSTSLATTWLLNDGMTHTLLKSSDLNLSASNWIPVPPNWTNSMNQNEVGNILQPHLGDPPTFFRLQSAAP
ncbi:MAG: choice-of-anchor tandem repeat GloVer-containing protein [Verrucomicrobiota bacterium]